MVHHIVGLAGGGRRGEEGGGEERRGEERRGEERRGEERRGEERRGEERRGGRKFKEMEKLVGEVKFMCRVGNYSYEGGG